MPVNFIYPGKELALFSNAYNWKRYMAGFIKPHLKGRVLEVGAGLGSMNTWLNISSIEEWTMLEPDNDMFAELQKKIADGTIKSNSTVIKGTIDDARHLFFDSIIYIDVLEHIQDDRTELNKAAMLLKTGGKLIVLSPAFQFLFSPFDEAIGHYRRYSKKTLQQAAGKLFVKQSMRYLDTVGFFSSLANKTLLRQKYPQRKQISLWDKFMVPVSTILDKLVAYSFGKSILGIWERQIRS